MPCHMCDICHENFKEGQKRYRCSKCKDWDCCEKCLESATDHHDHNFIVFQEKDENGVYRGNHYIYNNTKKVIVIDLESTGENIFAIGAVLSEFLIENGKIKILNFKKECWYSELPPDGEWEPFTLQWWENSEEKKKLKEEFRLKGKGISQEKMTKDFLKWFRKWEKIPNFDPIEIWTDCKDFDIAAMNELLRKYYPNFKSIRYAEPINNEEAKRRNVFDIDDGLFLIHPIITKNHKKDFFETYAKDVIKNHQPDNDVEYIFWCGAWSYYARHIMKNDYELVQKNPKMNL